MWGTMKLLCRPMTRNSAAPAGYPTRPISPGRCPTAESASRSICPTAAPCCCGRSARPTADACPGGLYSPPMIIRPVSLPCRHCEAGSAGRQCVPGWSVFAAHDHLPGIVTMPSLRGCGAAVAIRSPKASPFGRGAPKGGGEGPLSHGLRRASSPIGGAKTVKNLPLREVAHTGVAIRSP